MARILIVEDERAIRKVLRDILLNENKSYQIDEAENGQQAIDMAGDNFYDLLLCDIKMPGKDGVEVLRYYREHSPDTQVVMISGHGDMDTAIECIKAGAYDYLSKPPDLNRLLNTVRNALDRKNLIVENKILKKKVNRQYQMVGESPALQVVREMIDKIAPTDARVLITGSNGTGKELVARQIHEKSNRSSGPFVEVNCAAIPSELIESELFGHKKGAFTSAVKDRKGKFELADGGTLFLDEIGDMSLSAQAKVLRALQENKITPVGGDKDINVDVRVIAATNKNLQEEIAKGNFREDLYHRLSVIIIRMPTLAERKEDIPLLIDYFTRKISEEQGLPPKKFAPDAIAHLQGLPWTGNIRELRNVVERLMILGSNPVTLDEARRYV
ncbi:Fis family transcriptional regulator [Thermaurantimonas aggregans]|uniref:Fis family transcriptional regulator n=1 Tax=Thermaurantimonas aggregans TaxID=2173829 RepID=A0A401XJN9_9FLAO|nr:sigma-54 dependent transcriptional regulator [Thermaurantimonas aggregans]MCX8148627.1 sigma-54 dependent transcriptional regulator [Thermaurantimonas aggregans]GCD77204.1 Fis family transcriptional regulator [Thermaurantimonas aggregans]